MLLFAVGAVSAFLVLALVGRSRLDPDVPMRVPAIVVLNAFPILTVAVVLSVPQGAVSRGAAYLSSSFLATASYVVSLAMLIRLVEGRRRDKSLRR